MTATLDALRRGSLNGAREVALRDGLTEFPAELFGLAETLEVLDLSGNALTSLPPDMGRFRRLRILFCSNNRFERLPPSLGDCPVLSQIAFRSCGLAEIPGEALPPTLRWLTLTDNALRTLPSAIGRRPALQKLMLSGNRLEALPEDLADAANLELVRLAANRLDSLPPWLTDLPGLAWLAWAGNPFDRPSGISAPRAPWSELRPGALLGQGASGAVHQADWGGRAVALKLFKGGMTSDGLPEREMAACLAAGGHPNLTGALGRLVEHPDGADGLLMPLLPANWRVLADPPSRETCSRDVYDPALRLAPDVALTIARGIAAGASHLHGRGLLHGDLYAHNILWDGLAGEAVLSDFGAASFLPSGGEAVPFERLDVLAWGRLLGELLEKTGEAPSVRLAALHEACTARRPRDRPRMANVLTTLNAI